jgi:Vacuolar sorting 38 and autophagy-related subunit 14
VLGLSHATHLLTLLTDYLSLKLPYEIIPPSRGISYACIRKSSTTKPLPIYISPDKTPSSNAKAWASKKIKDLPGLDTFVEAINLLAWDIAWVLWTQQLWTYSTNESFEACRIARNLFHLVTSPKIGRISQGSTIEYLSTQEALGILPPFTLSVKDVQYGISAALEEDKTSEPDGGGWDIVEGGEEVLRGDGWLKLNST